MPMQHLYPQPRPETVERVRAHYRERYGRDLTYAEAHQVLYAVIRFLWLGGDPAGTAQNRDRKDGEDRRPGPAPRE